MRISDWSSDVCSSDVVDILHRDAADDALRQIGADRELALLVEALDLGRACTEADIGDNAQRHRSAGLRGDGQVLDRRQPLARAFRKRDAESGRASCRERVCPKGWI